jgi:hypothetical protein
MTPNQLIPLIAVTLLTSAPAATLIWADNFNTGLGQLTLDGAPLDGRRSGTEATNIMMRSSQRQMVSFNDQLYLWGSPGGRVRFQTDTTNWCNWAALPDAAAILSAGGLSVEFDISYTFNTNAVDFIGFAAGFKGASGGEPGIRTTDAETDYGLMIVKDGTYLRYANGVAIGDPVFGSTSTFRHVKIDYLFSSFADGSPVTVKTTVAGDVIASDTFTFNGNAGEFYMELENKGSDTYFDNFQVSTVTPYKIDIATNGYDFRTGAPGGAPVADFTVETLLNDSGTEDATFTLVAGDGDTDNSKFTLNSSNQLVTGSYNFKLGASGKSYSVRVKAVGKTSGRTTQQVFTVTPVKDDDNDNLPDDWELLFTNNLTDLTGLVFDQGSGPGSGDYDGDGIPDLDEYNIWLTTPGLSPVKLDSDGDGILDSEELNPTDPNHVITSPFLADTDGDGISDSAEYAGGTKPDMADTDGDGFRDGYEIAHGSNPNDPNSRPALPAGFALVQLTDDASSGIDASKTYTHHVSGGASATVNGVVFDALNTTSTPPNFAWAITNGNKSAATASTPGTWVPANGGVTGTGLLDLFDHFAYGSVNFNTSQTYTLSGLTPGQTYLVKLFIRQWSKEDATVRAIDLTYTNGTDSTLLFDALDYDRPGIVLNNGNDDSAYYVGYTYVAQGTTLTITAATPPQVSVDNGGAHFYGLTNEVVGTAPADLKITGVTRATTGALTLTFKGAASTAYKVTKSADLTTFTALSTPLTFTTDASGAATVVVPATEATATKGFFRIEK